MRAFLTARLLKWWHSRTYLTYCLLPLSWIFQFFSRVRYYYYYYCTQVQAPIPVIIVGNISVGGTGKTPLVAFIASFLQSQGYHPAIVVHGYASALKKKQVARAFATSDASLVGDEAVLLAKKNPLPVIVSRSRVQALAFLTQYCPEVDMVICDDGLQHYQLARDIEIAVIDGQRRFGNGFCLPVGPLRESVRRLAQVDFIVTNGQALQGEWPLQTQLGANVVAVNGAGAIQPLSDFVGKKVHAVAGIGQPERFFSMLDALGILLVRHRFTDHYLFKSADLQFDDNLPILMTEKDAVKCQPFARDNVWAVSLEVAMPQEFLEQLLRKIQDGQKTSRYSGLSNMQTTSSL